MTQLDLYLQCWLHMYCLERENFGHEKEESECKRIDVGLREPTRIENRKRYKGGASALG